VPEEQWAPALGADSGAPAPGALGDCLEPCPPASASPGIPLPPPLPPIPLSRPPPVHLCLALSPHHSQGLPSLDPCHSLSRPRSQRLPLFPRHSPRALACAPRGPSHLTRTARPRPPSPRPPPLPAAAASSATAGCPPVHLRRAGPSPPPAHPPSPLLPPRHTGSLPRATSAPAPAPLALCLVCRGAPGAAFAGSPPSAAACCWGCCSGCCCCEPPWSACSCCCCCCCCCGVACWPAPWSLKVVLSTDGLPGNAGAEPRGAAEEADRAQGEPAGVPCAEPEASPPRRSPCRSPCCRPCCSTWAQTQVKLPSGGVPAAGTGLACGLPVARSVPRKGAPPSQRQGPLAQWLAHPWAAPSLGTAGPCAPAHRGQPDHLDPAPAPAPAPGLAPGGAEGWQIPPQATLEQTLSLPLQGLLASASLEPPVHPRQPEGCQSRLVPETPLAGSSGGVTRGAGRRGPQGVSECARGHFQG